MSKLGRHIVEEQTLSVVATKDFQRDYKKLTVKQTLSNEFIEIMYLLQHNKPLPKKYKDHPLSGNLKEFRDCHIFNDLVLIYRINGTALELIRVNTHSEIFKKKK